MKKVFFLCLLAVISAIADDASWAQATLARMSVREKIGQLFMVATASSFDQPEEALALQLFRSPYKMDHDYIQGLIRDYHIGGLIFLFKSTPDKQIDVTNRFQLLSNIPLLIGQDCEWGLSMRLYDTVRFPKNMTLGALTDTQLLFDIGYEIGMQCRALGVHINFAPVMDVNVNPANPVINDRSFGQDPAHVATCGTQIINGLQAAGIMACAKHFPGHGDVTVDSHHALPIIHHARDRLDMVELYPFRAAIAAGVDAIMTAHIVVPALCGPQELPATLSAPVLNNLLRQELGFDGLVITDGLGMKALAAFGDPGQLELQALLAGNDILLCPLDVPAAVALIEQAITDGTLSEQELDAKVLKILRAKEQLGITNRQQIDPQVAVHRLHTVDAYHLKQELFSHAITVVANTLLPLTAASTPQAIIIGADQSSAFERTLIDYGVPAHHVSKFDNGDDLVDKIPSNIVIVGLFGMNKFATQQFGVTEQTRLLLQRLHDADKQVILVIFGNPYSLSLFDVEQTIVVAYEDDADAQQAAVRVLFGDMQPRGKLPVTAFERFRCGAGLNSY